MKKFLLLLFTVIFLFASCGADMQVKMKSMTIEESFTVRLGESTKVARAKFDIYDCKDLKSEMSDDEIRAWLTANIKCEYQQSGLELDGFIRIYDKKENMNSFTAEYLLPDAEIDESAIGKDLKFFILENVFDSTIF